MTLLLGSFLILLLLRFPVSFSLLVSSLLYMLVAGINPVVAIQRMSMGIGDSFPLLAVPFFILAGNIMNIGGVTTRIFNFANVLVGHITGGLGHVNILGSVIFAGMSGTAIADAGGLGAIEIKAMKDAGYDEDFAIAVTGASSLIGPIIPPSVPAVVFGVIAGVSVGRLFVAGVIPGLLMALVMGVFVFFVAKKHNYPKNKRASFDQILVATKEAFWCLLTPVLIIGSILGGIITPTEAAVLAVIYSLILALAYKEIGWKDIPKLLLDSANITVGVMLIVACASLFAWILASEQIPQKLTQFFLATIPSLPVAIIVVNVLLLVVGCFMETIAALTILTPVLLPVMVSFGMDPVHFGLIMILNLMIGLLTPPVGMVLYVLSSVTKVPFTRIARVCFPYVVLMFALVLGLAFVPPLATWLPNLVFGVAK
jgi:tripartite ATP-independent transporter DctM subunit